MGRLWKILPFLAILNGCYSDFSLWHIPDQPAIPEDAPDITVSPGEVDFGALNADGEAAAKTIIIGNRGNETLYIDEIQLNIVSNVFTVSPLDGEDELEPGETAKFTVTYDPITY